MNVVPTELIEQCVAIIGRTGVTENEIESEVLALAQDQVLARRLIDCVPEAFGIVLAAHISSELVLPTKFSAKLQNSDMEWFKFEVEPIFVSGFKLAQLMFHHGSREVFQKLAVRSAMLNTVNKLLNAGGKIEGAVLSGPVMLGIPAEIYPKPKKSLIERFFAWRLARMRKAKR